MFKFALCILLPAALSAQAMLSHGLAAGSGSLAGGMAGKKVSDVLNKVRGVEEVATKAGVKPSPSQELKRGPVLTPMPASDHIAPSRSRTRPLVALRQRPLHGDPVPAIPSIVSPATLMVLPPPAPIVLGEASGDELRTVSTGAPREAVLGKLGIPASRVSIPDEGGMREIWYYTKRGDVSGAVRLVNGVVTVVQVN